MSVPIIVQISAADPGVGVDSWEGYYSTTPTHTTIAASATVTDYKTLYDYNGSYPFPVATMDVQWVAMIFRQREHTPRYIHRVVIPFGEQVRIIQPSGCEFIYELDAASTNWRVKSTIYNPTAGTLNYDNTASPTFSITSATVK